MINSFHSILDQFVLVPIHYVKVEILWRERGNLRSIDRSICVGLTRGVTPEIPPNSDYHLLILNMSERKPTNHSTYAAGPTADYESNLTVRTFPSPATSLLQGRQMTPLAPYLIAEGLTTTLKFSCVRYTCSCESFTPATNRKPQKGGIVDTLDRRPLGIAECTCSRGRDQGDEEKGTLKR